MQLNTLTLNGKTYDRFPDGRCYIATEHGIIPDPTADNTLAMQKLIEKVHNAGGGIIWLPIGEYGFDRNSKDRIKVTDDFRTCVQPMSDVSLMGESLTKTVIKVYGANSDTAWMANQVDKNSTDVALSGFTYQNFTVDMSASELAVDANGQFIYSSSAKAFGMKALKNCVFRDLRILESPATSFGIDMLDNVVIDSLYIYKGGKRWSYGNPGGAGIGIGTGRWEQENFIVRNCICAGCGHFGIFIEDQGLFSSPPVNKYTMGQIITNNVVRNGRHYGIGVRGGQNIVVTSNNIYRNKGGIYMDYGAKRVMVSNNAITENTENGLLFGTEDVREGFNGFACENISVSGNSFIKNKLGLSVMREPIDSKIEDNTYIGNDADMPVEILIDESKIMQDVYIDNYGEYITLAGNVLYDEFIDLDTTMVTWTPIGETATGALHNPRIAIYAEDKSFIWRINGDYKPDELRSEIEAALTAHGGRTDYRYIKFGDNCNGEILSTLKLYDLTANTGSDPAPMQPLTFTGAVNATYDGSLPVSVEIPQGGGSEKWRKLGEVILDEDVTEGTWFSIDADMDGNPIDLQKMLFVIANKVESGTSPQMLFRAYKYTNGNPNYVVMGANAKDGLKTVIFCELVKPDESITMLKTIWNNNSIHNAPGGNVTWHEGINQSKEPSYITGCNFQLNNGMLAGTKYTLWGVDRV